MAEALPAAPPQLDPAKFRDPLVTARGEPRAVVALRQLDTLWFNTGTLCNLACKNCYIASSPTDDRLVYLTHAEVLAYLDEIAQQSLPTSVIGFTGGEPFMNPDLCRMLESVLSRGFKALVLTNAMKPMMKCREPLQALQRTWGDALTLRVSIDHYSAAIHELERGPRSFQPTIDGLQWLAQSGFAINVATRRLSSEAEPVLRAGFARLFASLQVGIDAHDPVALMVFPEMDATVDVPEITQACWGILHKTPDDVMCSSSRMIVKRRGASAPVVLACTLLADDPRFELGATLRDAQKSVALNHPHCAKFCVLGGAACSR